MRVGNRLATEYSFFQESLQVAERMGDRDTARFVRVIHLVSWALGHWDEALREANEFIAACESGSPHYMESHVRETRATILLARGEVEAALGEYRHTLELARQSNNPRSQLPTLGLLVRAHMLLGRTDEAKVFARELISCVRGNPDAEGVLSIISAFADALGIAEEARELVAQAPPSAFKEGAAAELEGDPERAAAVFSELGFVSREADSRLYAAQNLIDAGRRAEGEAELQKALAFYRSVGATFFIQRAERLLAESA
jgi:tetratricopeptide (TPR) repeat protein